MYAHSPHEFMFSSSLTFWEAAGHFDHPSFTFSGFFSSLCMPSPSSGSHRNIVVHSDHSLFNFVHVCCVFGLLAKPCFVLGCSPVVTIINHVYEKVCSFVVSLVLLCNGILCHRVSGILFFCVDIVVCCVCIFFLGLN